MSDREATRAEQGSSESREASPRPWPVAGKVAVTVILVIHLGGVFIGALAGGGSPSPLWTTLADPYRFYFEALDLGYAYQFYSRPGPTPIALARLTFRDGSEQTLRLPGPEVRPRIRYQRQLALAYHLHQDALALERARAQDPGITLRSWVAESYARHLLETTPESVEVELAYQMYFVDIAEVLQRLNEPGSRGSVDLSGEEFYSEPVIIGVYPRDFNPDEAVRPSMETGPIRPGTSPIRPEPLPLPLPPDRRNPPARPEPKSQSQPSLPPALPDPLPRL